MMMHAGAEIDEPFRPLDQRCQDIGRQRVDRENMWQAVGGNAVAFAIANRRIVDHSIKAAERIDLSGHILCARDRLEIAGHDRFRV